MNRLLAHADYLGRQGRASLATELRDVVAERDRLRALLLCAASDLAWCTGFIEQAGSEVPQSVRRTIEKALSSSGDSDVRS